MYAESEMQVIKLYPTVHPIINRLHSPIFFSNMLPSKFSDFVPQP